MAEKKFPLKVDLDPILDMAGLTETVRRYTSIVLLSDCLGDADTRYGDRELLELTSENIANHAGLVVELSGVVVRDATSDDPNATLSIKKLVLKGDVASWPKQIAEQIENIRELKELRELLEQAEGDPRFLKQLAAVI